MDDLSRKRTLWTKHATRQAVEDNLSMKKIETKMDKCLLIDSGLGKRKAIIKLNKEYVTLIIKKYRHGTKIITCWKSSNWETKAYDNELKEVKR